MERRRGRWIGQWDIIRWSWRRSATWLAGACLRTFWKHSDNVAKWTAHDSTRGRQSATKVDTVSLNIKDPEIHQLARELADLTGESMTRAIGEAVKDRLKRVRSARRKRRMSVTEMLALGKRVGSKIKEPLVDHAELLY